MMLRSINFIKLLIAFSLIGTCLSAQEGPTKTAQSEETQTVISGGVHPAYQRQRLAQLLSRDPDNRVLRYEYARFSYMLGDFDSAKFNLKKLMREGTDPEELRVLQEDYYTVIREQPFGAGASLEFLPSTNIERSARRETILAGFAIGGQAKTGIGVRLGANMSYETRPAIDQSLIFSGNVGFRFFPNPDANYVDATISMTHGFEYVGGVVRTTPYISRQRHKPTYLFTRRRNNDDHFRFGLSVSQEWYLPEDASLSASVNMSYSDYDDKKKQDGPFVSGSLNYATPIGEDMRLNLSGRINTQRPKLATYARYDGYSFDLSLTQPLGKTGQVGTHLGYGARHYHYPHFSTPNENRLDKFGNVGLSYSNHRIRLFNIVPRVKCTTSLTESNVKIFDLLSTDCSLSFFRSF